MGRIEYHSNKRKDEWSKQVLTRISTSNDLVANVAIYHKDCLTRYILNWPFSDVPKGKRGRSVDEIRNKWFEMLCIWLENEADGELYSLTELHDKMTEMANGEEVYSQKWLKSKLVEKYKETIFFSELNGHPNVLCFREAEKQILNSKWYETKKENLQEESERIIRTAAKLILAEIREQIYDKTQYPSTDDITKKTYIPRHLQTFLEVLVKRDTRQKAIGQAIVYAAKPRSFIPPILFGLGVEMDHVFGSRWLIDELNSLGFCISYSEVQRFKESAIKENDISRKFEGMLPGTFNQFSGDNVDHNINTLDGKNIFHGMGVIAASSNRNGFESNHVKIRRSVDQSREYLQEKGIKIVPYTQTCNKPGLSNINFLPIKDLKLPEIVRPNPNINLLWLAAQLIPTYKRPNWSGFMQTFLHGENPGKAEITLLPIINLKSTDESCIYSTLLYILEICKKFNFNTPCITFDQHLRLKATEILKEKSLNIESGKAISRALRAHFLLQSALYSLLIADVLNPDDLALLKGCYEDIVTKESCNMIENNGILSKLDLHLFEKMEKLESKSRTAKLWFQYMKYVNIVKLFIFSERTGNWPLHLESCSLMLNLYSATGHVNYAKSTRLYFQLMCELPSTHPELHNAFIQGQYHSVWKSDRYWGGLWIELVIEQSMMRTLKSRGGLTRGHGMSESVNLTWIHSMHACGSIHSAMTELTKNKHKTSEQHVDLGASRMKRDSDDLQKLVEWLYPRDPIFEDEIFLKSISSGLTAKDSDQINCDEPELIDKKIQDQLDGVAFTAASIKRRDQVRTLERLNVGITVDEEKVQANLMVLFTRLLVLAERSEDRRVCFDHELTPTPTSLFENGLMRKPNKSALGRALRQEVPIVDVPSKSF